ncbi:hypothetical protein [Novosphingobium aquae]|jgi:hypothetical protein|uniref:Sugar transporter n=1 Tax=Novosphingobium aquae TaxID=3133435 RepID=A0ABU8S6I3_9SPHN
MTNGTKAPTIYWVVAVLGLLWNCIGAYLYIQTRLNPDVMLASAPQEIRDYVTNMPLWANIGYGLGVWGSLAGSVLMLLRSRHAPNAFLVSLVGALVSYLGQFLAGVLGPAEPAMILAGILLLWWYSRRAAAQGILK